MRKFLLFATLLFTLVSTAWAQYVPTPNIGLEIPANGSNNWNIPLNYNFNRLDQLLSGQLSLPALSVSGNVTVSGSVTANSFIGAGGAGLATASIASQWSPVYYSASPTGNSFAGVAPFTGLAKYSATGPPSAAILSDVNSLLKTGTNCNITGTVFSPFSANCVSTGGNPAGSNTDVQFNSSATFDADTGWFFYNKTNHMLTSNANGFVNTDLYRSSGTGNDGIANALASAQCATTCNLYVPSTSNSTEVPPTIPFGSTLADYRNNSTFIYANSPALGVNAGLYCAQTYTVFCERWDFSNLPTPIYTRLGQSVHMQTANFNSQGWNYGPAPGSPTPNWSTQFIIYSTANVNTRGIYETQPVVVVKHAIGDMDGRGYDYTSCDGGQPDYAGEGCGWLASQNGETSNFFNGFVGTGAVAGSTSLPIVYNSSYTPSNLNRNATTDGSYMLDITQGSIVGNTTGPSTAASGLNQVSSIPVNVSVTPSTAMGNLACTLTIAAPFTSPNTATCNVTNIVGTNAGGFVAGHAFIGGDFPEGTTISSPGVISGGTQQITLTFLHPHGSLRTTIWQGSNVIDNFISWDRHQALNGFKLIYHVYGAIDSTHLAVENVPGGPAYSPYLAPNNITNLSRTGNTVTATYTGSNSIYDHNNATIAGCSDPTMNEDISGAVQSFSPNPLTLTWTSATSGTASCATATIQIPASYTAFHLFPGAEVLGPATSAPATIAIGVNNVAWTSGDVLEEPHHPFYNGYGIKEANTVNNSSPTSLGQGVMLVSKGAGVNTAYFPLSVTNQNPCSMYLGCGGFLNAPIMITTRAGGTNSPNSGGFWLGEAPLNQNPVVHSGCADVALGGCSNQDPIVLLQTDNGGNWKYNVVRNAWYSNNNINLTTTISAPGGSGSYMSANYFNSPSGFGGTTSGYNSSSTTGVMDTFMTRTAVGTYSFGKTAGASDGTVNAGVVTIAGQNVCQQNGTNCLNPILAKGKAILVAGTVSVTNAVATTSLNYSLTNCGVGGTIGILSVVPGTGSFVINSNNAADTSTVCWSIY